MQVENSKEDESTIIVINCEMKTVEWKAEDLAIEDTKTFIQKSEQIKMKY